MIHVFPRWSFGYLQKDKPKHTAAGHESYTDRSWTSRNIDHLEHETIAFENLPTEVQHYLENPTI